MNKEINFDNIAAMLCGEALTEEQMEDVKEFQKQYDEAHDKKTADNH